MSNFKENIAHFGNGKRDNINFTINAGNIVTLNFNDSGANTGINKYYNLGSEAKKVSIVVNQIATITHINNQELQSPIRLGTAAANTWKSGIEWGSIKVRADVAATTFEIYAS